MLSGSDYRQVAVIHAASISKGFLSTMGEPFLALMYEAIDKSPESVLIVEKVDGAIIGFVAGTSNLGSVYRVMLKSWGRLMVALLPSLVSPRRVFRIFETVFFSGKNQAPNSTLPADELLSIAVLPDGRGKGYADKLFVALQDHFRERGVRSFKIIVGDVLAPAHRFYKKMGAIPSGRAEVHRGSGSTIYVCKL